MKSAVVRCGMAMALAAVLPLGRLSAAEEGTKALPTLLIKGEVVSLDTNDPAANLLKVKDRYGFETPIFLTSETKVTQGDAPFTVANLAAGTMVEVEYNFDINTAKRHAVSVKVSAPAAAPVPATPAAVPAAPAAPTATVAPTSETAPASSAPAAAPAVAPQPPAPVAPASAPAAETPSTQEGTQAPTAK